MPNEAGKAAATFLESYFTAKKYDDDQKRWEAEFQLEQERQRADMNARKREQVKFEQDQEKRAGEKELFAAMEKAGLIPKGMGIDTPDEFDIHARAQAVKSAVEQSDYEKTLRGTKEKEAAADLESRQLQNKESALTLEEKKRAVKGSVEGNIPDWMLPQYSEKVGLLKQAYERAEASRRDYEGLMAEYKIVSADVMNQDPQRKQDLVDRMNELRPAIAQSELAKIALLHDVNEYNAFGVKYKGKATGFDWLKFTKERDAENKARKAEAQKQAEAEAKAAQTASYHGPYNIDPTEMKTIGDIFVPLGLPKGEEGQLWKDSPEASGQATGKMLGEIGSLFKPVMSLKDELERVLNYIPRGAGGL